QFRHGGENPHPKEILLDGPDIRHHSARAFFGRLTGDRPQFVPSVSSIPGGRRSAGSGPRTPAAVAAASPHPRPPTRSSARSRRPVGGHAASPTSATGGRRSA